MNRRQFLKSGCVATSGLLGATAPVAARESDSPPGVTRRRAYEGLAIASAASAHDGGRVFVGRDGRWSDADEPVRVVTVDETGDVRQRQEIEPDIPEDARRASADVIRTENGYAVATGSWFATLDPELSVETTGFTSEYLANSTTFLTELSDGFAVATELDTPNHVMVMVSGFDADGNRRWTREYGERNSKWLRFLLDGPDGGLVVGESEPWLASIAADGTERWTTTVSDVSRGVGSDAVRDGDGIVLFGSSSMVRLTDSRTVDWQRSYDSFSDTFGEKIARTADGGYVVAAAATADRIRVGRTDENGRLQWSHEYTAVEDGRMYLKDIVERSPGEYLVVGSRRDVRKGWTLSLSETETPTPLPTSTTTSTSAETVQTTPEATTGTSTNTAVPGFGIGTALVGTAAGLWTRRR